MVAAALGEVNVAGEMGPHLVLLVHLLANLVGTQQVQTALDRVNLAESKRETGKEAASGETRTGQSNPV